MIPVKFDGAYLLVEAGPRDTRHMRKIIGSRFVRAKQWWAVPATLAGYEQLIAQFDFDLDFTDAARDRLYTLRDAAELQEMARAATHPIKSETRLYPFQAAGVRFIGNGGQVLLADEMGTGKTVQSLVAVELEAAWPLLVVCTNSMKHRWAEEVRKWTTATPIVIEGTKPKRLDLLESAHALIDGATNTAVIINYEGLLAHSSQMSFGNAVLTEEQLRSKELNDIGWGSVIADEVHKAKSPKAQRTRALWSVSKDVPMRIGMTGTPVMNDPDDLWSIMRFVCPAEWSSRSRFRDRYCDVVAGWHGGIENFGLLPQRKDELDKFLRPRMIRRLKVDVLPDLPEKMPPELRIIPITGKQATAYNQLVKHMMAAVKGGTLVVTDPLVLLGRLRFLASAFCEVDSNGEITSLNTPSNKLDAVKDIIEEGGTPIVIAAESRKLIELLDSELSSKYSTCLITGTVPAKVRHANVELFQAGKIDLMLLTLGAGAEGIDLYAADRTINVSASYSNATNKQLGDRIHRIGQLKVCQNITLASEGTIDMAVHAIGELKEEQLQSLVRDEDRFYAMIRGEL